MYEVEFAVSTDIGNVFTQARLSVDDIDFNAINGQVFNCINESPPSSMGFAPSYDSGARGPTPRLHVYQPLAFVLSFPAQIIDAGTDSNASRYFLNRNAVRFFERLVKLNARRSDLQMSATIGVKIRRLLEENEPSDENAVSASALYSAIVEYEKVQITDAGGNQSSYNIACSALTRPKETEIENYGANT